MFKITRQQIVDTALTMEGVPFLHQGRTMNGVDCVGMLVVLGEKVGYPEIIDVTDYRRVPKSEEIKAVLGANCNEIPLEDVGIGDIYFMRHHARKPRHASIKVSDTQMIHANGKVVRLDYLSDFPESWFIAGFRLRGLVDE